MSDLNQLIRDVKEEGINPQIRKYMHFLINRFEREGVGPICCFYTGELSDIIESSSKNYKTHLTAENFQNLAKDSEEIVGCTRGCMPYSKLMTSEYGEKLCRFCIVETKRLLKDGKK
jgi:hypothetical protein